MLLQYHAIMATLTLQIKSRLIIITSSFLTTSILVSFHFLFFFFLLPQYNRHHHLLHLHLYLHHQRPRPLSPNTNRKEEPLVNPVPPLRVEPVEEARVPPVIEDDTPAKAAIPTAGNHPQILSSSHVFFFLCYFFLFSHLSFHYLDLNFKPFL